MQTVEEEYGAVINAGKSGIKPAVVQFERFTLAFPCSHYAEKFLKQLKILMDENQANPTLYRYKIL